MFSSGVGPRVVSNEGSLAAAAASVGGDETNAAHNRNNPGAEYANGAAVDEDESGYTLTLSPIASTASAGEIIIRGPYGPADNSSGSPGARARPSLYLRSTPATGPSEMVLGRNARTRIADREISRRLCVIRLDAGGEAGRRDDADGDEGGEGEDGDAPRIRARAWIRIKKPRGLHQVMLDGALVHAYTEDVGGGGGGRAAAGGGEQAAAISVDGTEGEYGLEVRDGQRLALLGGRYAYRVRIERGRGTAGAAGGVGAAARRRRIPAIAREAVGAVGGGAIPVFVVRDDPPVRAAEEDLDGEPFSGDEYLGVAEAGAGAAASRVAGRKSEGEEDGDINNDMNHETQEAAHATPATARLRDAAREHLVDDTTCPVCMELLVKTVTAHPCGHSFCGPCAAMVLGDLAGSANSSASAASAGGAASAAGGFAAAAGGMAAAEGGAAVIELEGGAGRAARAWARGGAGAGANVAATGGWARASAGGNLGGVGFGFGAAGADLGFGGGAHAGLGTHGAARRASSSGGAPPHNDEAVKKCPTCRQPATTLTKNPTVDKVVWNCVLWGEFYEEEDVREYIGRSGRAVSEEELECIFHDKAAARSAHHRRKRPRPTGVAATANGADDDEPTSSPERKRPARPKNEVGAIDAGASAAAPRRGVPECVDLLRSPHLAAPPAAAAAGGEGMPPAARQMDGDGRCRDHAISID